MFIKGRYDDVLFATVIVCLKHVMISIIGYSWGLEKPSEATVNMVPTHGLMPTQMQSVLNNALTLMATR